MATYIAFRSLQTALVASVAATPIALFAFGYVKGRFTTTHPFRSAWQTTFVVGLAAAAAFAIAKALA